MRPSREKALILRPLEWEIESRVRSPPDRSPCEGPPRYSVRPFVYLRSRGNIDRRSVSGLELTRRLRARPSAVSLASRGRSSPKPCASSRLPAMSRCTSHFITASARRWTQCAVAFGSASVVGMTFRTREPGATPGMLFQHFAHGIQNHGAWSPRVWRSPVMNSTRSRILIPPASTRAFGQPFLVGSGLVSPGASGQASSQSRTGRRCPGRPPSGSRS